MIVGKEKKALLLHYAGDEVFKIYGTLDNTGDENGFDETKQALTNYFKPKVNTEFEIFEFRQMKQFESETCDDFSTRLRQKAEYCDFHDKDKELKSQIIQGCKSSKLRCKALQDNLNLTDLLLTARTMELATKQADQMDHSKTSELRFESNGHTAEQSNKLKSVKKRPANKQFNKQKSGTAKKPLKCRNCGGEFPHNQGPCPAIGKVCSYCKKKNHFLAVCYKKKQKDIRDKQIKQVDRESDFSSSDVEISETDTSFGVKVHQVKRKPPKTEIMINGQNCKLLVDTGSSINLLNETFVNKMKPPPKISKTDTKAYAYGQRQNYL